MGLLGKILDKLLLSVPEEEMDGIMLDLRACWEVSKIKEKSGSAFFSALDDLLPSGATLCLEGTSISKDVKSFLRGRKVDEICKVQRGTLWPKPDFYHVLCDRETLVGLAELSERSAWPEICDHLHVYKDERILLEWFDAFYDPLYVSKDFMENDLKTFCSTLGCTYKDASVPDWPGHSLHK